MHYHHDPNQTITIKSPHAYRIMTYNVHGFMDIKYKNQLKSIIDVIAQIKPDILVLEEVFFRKRNEIITDDKLVDIMRANKLPHYAFSLCGINAVFSKYPFTYHEIDLGKDHIKRVKRNALVCDFSSVIVVGAHFDVFDETGMTRAHQIGLVLRELGICKNKRCIVTGDFNSLRMADYSVDEWANLVKNDLERGVNTVEDIVPILEGVGFRDSFSHCGKSLKVSVWSNRRVDYVYGLNIDFVYCSELRVAFSDHYPVYADFVV